MTDLILPATSLGAEFFGPVGRESITWAVYSQGHDALKGKKGQNMIASLGSYFFNYHRKKKDV